MSLYSHTFYSESLNRLLSAENFITYMLLVESELAASQAEAGLIPAHAAMIIKTCADIKYMDVTRLKQDIVLGGNAAIPMVKQLTILVKSTDFEASKHVHLGATSQDIIDTATVLLLKDVWVWIAEKLAALSTAVRDLSIKHQGTLMIGRTLMQHAKPITFGLKTALWYKSLQEDMSRLSTISDQVSNLQMAGAVGAGNNKLTEGVVADLSERLGLRWTPSWQSSRGQLCAFASALGILAGNMGKIARDVSLLMQTEIAEVHEGAAEGKGGSSTMPHKRNPVNSALILANATRVPALVSTMLTAMTQEHERSAGLWHAEWETLIELIALTGGMIEKSIDLMKHLEVDEKRMMANLEITRGLIYAENVMLALAPEYGKLQAMDLIEKACKTAIKQNRHLKEVLVEAIGESESLEGLFDPHQTLGYCMTMSARILNLKADVYENALYSERHSA